jgi:hypothetical protein
VHPHQWKLHKAIRMCHQTYEQGGLLTNQDQPFQGARFSSQSHKIAEE